MNPYNIKVNAVLVAISVALSCLIGYLAFSIGEGKENDVLCGVFSTVCFMATTVPVVGLQYGQTRLGVNVRVMSSLFFVLFLVSHFCFAAIGIKMPYYIILNGILLLVYCGVLYKMLQINKI